jgi:hypothetical protein
MCGLWMKWRCAVAALSCEYAGLCAFFVQSVQNMQSVRKNIVICAVNDAW